MIRWQVMDEASFLISSFLEESWENGGSSPDPDDLLERVVSSLEPLYESEREQVRLMIEERV